VAANLASCALTAGYTIAQRDVGAALQAMVDAGAFDLIVLDPPYAEGAARTVLAAAGERLAQGGWIVLERATRVQPDVPESLVRLRDIESGDSTLTLFGRAQEGE
jgi:16S rRNA G966 N2-methylase RsmD